ncbi:NapC/NirT family cytochrome c [Deferribacter thermophilus]|uniref:cytochrome c3 family protein n=1 Tax=Deferribacter thermophilus TaxID=53573 RepID=UPI003C1FF0DF
MWGKLKEFIRRDPVVFVILFTVIIVGFIFVNIEVLHYTSESEFCGKCHPEEKVGPLGEYYTWSKNIHSTAKVECIDCHGEPGFIGYMKAKIGGLKDLYGEIFLSDEHKLEILTEGATNKEKAAELVPNETCMFCHTDSVNKKLRRERLMSVGVKFRMIDTVINPKFRESFGRPDILTEDTRVGVVPNHKKHIEAGLNCVDCHLGVAHGGEFHNLPKMETCFTCHFKVKQEKKNVKVPDNMDCAKCHTLQDKIQQGVFVKEIEETPWYMDDLSCTDCHEDPFVRPNTDTCASCHDSSYGEMLIDTQKEFLAKLEKVQKVRDKLFEERLEMPEGKRKLFNKLQFLVRTMEMDGSKGFHNPEYFDLIFDKANELIEKIENYVEPESKEEAKLSMKSERKAEHEGEKEENEADQGESHTLKAENPVELVEIAPDTINIAENHGIDTTKKPVIFPHKKHFEMFKCEECHSKPDEGSLKVEIKVLKGTSNTFHKEICFPCHKEYKVKKGTSCSTCHK